jgi:uncharacterized protein (TIGR02145 family)
MRRQLTFIFLSFHAIALYGQTDELIDSRDGKKYRTVRIGAQVWMRDNLSYAPFITSASDLGNRVSQIFKLRTPEGKESNEFYEKFEKEYETFIFCYSDSLTNCATFGSLYSYESALKACPSGWHLPSKQEFETLVSFAVDEKKDSYLALSRNGSLEFDALLGGILYDFGEFEPYFKAKNVEGYYWTSTVASRPGQMREVYRVGFFRRSKKIRINRILGGHTEGLSVRCVKND